MLAHSQILTYNIKHATNVYCRETDPPSQPSAVRPGGSFHRAGRAIFLQSGYALKTIVTLSLVALGLAATHTFHRMKDVTTRCIDTNQQLVAQNKTFAAHINDIKTKYYLFKRDP